MHEKIDIVILQAPLSIPNMSAIEHYLLIVTVNGTASFNTTVPASTTSVNIFETFPNISQRRYTTYSLSVASISSIGRSYRTEPVSIGKIVFVIHMFMKESGEINTLMYVAIV